jgi:hypothetical protein
MDGNGRPYFSNAKVGAKPHSEKSRTMEIGRMTVFGGKSVSRKAPI